MLDFLINILCAIFVVYFGANIAFITNPLGGILYLDKLQIPFLHIPTLTLFSDLVAIALDSLGYEHVKLEQRR